MQGGSEPCIKRVRPLASAGAMLLPTSTAAPICSSIASAESMRAISIYTKTFHCRASKFYIFIEVFLINDFLRI